MENHQYVFAKPHTIVPIVEELSTPNKDYVTVRFIACGICGGDYSTYIGRRNNYPQSLGHEFVAEIIKKGENVSDFTIGQMVISDFNYRCGKCQYCLSGRSHLCVENSIHLFSNRAFAQYGNIHQNYLVGISEITNIYRACFMEPLSCVIYAIKYIPHTPSSNILIYGCGSIGTMAVFYLSKVLNYKNIYVYDINEERLKNVMKCFGVHNLILSKTSPDLIIECTNQETGVSRALDLAIPGSTICIMSHLYGIETSFIYEKICQKELRSFFPLRNGDRKNLLEAIELITKHWEQKYDMLYHTFSNIYYIFKNKLFLPCNKQIFDIKNADWDSNY